MHNFQQRKIKPKCSSVKSGEMAVRMPPCARGSVLGLLVGASLLQTHHFPPVSMHMCQREVGNPLLIVPLAEEHQTVFVAIPRVSKGMKIVL